MRLFNSIILSLITAALLCSAIVIYAPGPKPDVLVWVGLSIQLVWVLCIFYSYWTKSPYQPFIVMSLTSIISAILIWIS